MLDPVGEYTVVAWDASPGTTTRCSHRR